MQTLSQLHDDSPPFEEEERSHGRRLLAGILCALLLTGAIFGGYLMPPVRTMDEFDRFAGAVLIATAYLPAVLVVLRRPNEGQMPAWLDFVARRLKGRLKREKEVSAT